jgi:hypothetical protein
MLVAVVISGFHALHEHGEDVLSEAVAPPFFSREETSRQFLVRLAQLLVAVLADDRVKTPDAAGNVLGTLRALLAVPEYGLHPFPCPFSCFGTTLPDSLPCM